jgi:hypothetical protein
MRDEAGCSGRPRKQTAENFREFMQVKTNDGRKKFTTMPTCIVYNYYTDGCAPPTHRETVRDMHLLLRRVAIHGIRDGHKSVGGWNRIATSSLPRPHMTVHNTSCSE